MALGNPLCTVAFACVLVRVGRMHLAMHAMAMGWHLHAIGSPPPRMLQPVALNRTPASLSLRSPGFIAALPTRRAC